MNKEQQSLYRSRRAKFAKFLGNRAFILPGATLATRNADITYPFRQESNFLYLTGWTEPNAFLMVEGGENPSSTIFFNAQSQKERLWNGKIPTHKQAVGEYGFDTALALSKTPFTPESDIDMSDALAFLAELRLIKDKTEIRAMTKAARVSAHAHREAMRFVRPWMHERNLAGMLTHHFLIGGGDPLNAYPSIVAAGSNACTLHYQKLDGTIQNGDLVLVDAGAEVDGYASDITRTFPANGTFSDEQRALYEIVLDAQKQAIKKARTGNAFDDIHKAATKTITRGLLRLGILKGKDADVKQFFPHRTSHWLGLDVHDVGNYQKDDCGILARTLRPGMVLTVEPGIYIPKNARNVEAKWRGIGIRIEDDILITESGNEVLSRDAPKEVAEIEALMKQSR